MMTTMKITPATLAALQCHSTAFEATEPEDMCPATFEGTRMTFRTEDKMALWSYLSDAANSADEMVTRGGDAATDRRMSTSLSRLASKVIRS